MPRVGLALTVTTWESQLRPTYWGHGGEDFFAPAGSVESNEAHLDRQTWGQGGLCPVPGAVPLHGPGAGRSQPTAFGSD